MMKAHFRAQLSAESEPLPHFWEHTVGSCHATLTLRSDWQKQITRARQELGFQHVRFHGILSDDMGTLVCQQDKLIYSFFNLDQLFDFLLSIGMRPFLELSFMPEAIASGSDLVFHYRGNITPPKTSEDWGNLIHELGTHLVDRYGIEEIRRWFFEVWNEPNLKAFWTGSQADYFRLYKNTAETLKKIDAQIKVGGPATAKNEWIPEFVQFCEKNSVPYDFVSTHHYPTDAFGKPGDDTVTQLAESKRSILRTQTEKVKSEANGKPLYYTEWCSSSNPFDDLHDTAYASAFIIKTVLEARGLVLGYSYWTFSDIFEENYFSSKPYHGGFGLMNIYGIPKPAYRAYEILHRLGDRILKVEELHATVDCFITRQENKIQIIVNNYARPHHPVKTENVIIHLEDVAQILSSSIERIDDEHANPRAAWVEMGSPPSLKPAMVAALEKASQLTKKEIKIPIHGTTAEITVAIPPQGTALITLEVQPCSKC
jgi:xylan 1,4-beta-xylosidase